MDSPRPHQSSRTRPPPTPGRICTLSRALFKRNTSVYLRFPAKPLAVACRGKRPPDSPRAAYTPKQRPAMGLRLTLASEIDLILRDGFVGEVGFVQEKREMLVELVAGTEIDLSIRLHCRRLTLSAGDGCQVLRAPVIRQTHFPRTLLVIH